MRTDAEIKYEEKLSRDAKRSGLLQTWLTDNMLSVQNPALRVKEIRLKLGREGQSPILVIVKCDQAGRALVGFHGALTFEDALRGSLEKVMNNSLKWREDRPYKPPATP